MTENFAVEITAEGRSGWITYREGVRRHAFGWEFGAGPAVALIFAPPPARWAAELPWAAGRRDEVLDRIGREVVRQKAPRCTYTVHAGGIDILEPAAR